MHFKNLTFNDLPTVVGELCKRIENLETVLKTVWQSKTRSKRTITFL